MPLAFLLGQSLIACLPRLPPEARFWLLAVPLLFLLRRWSWLALGCGGLWQFIWQSPQPGVCHAFFWFLCDASPEGDPLPRLLLGTAFDRIAGSFVVWAQNFFLSWDAEWGPWFLQFAFGIKDGQREAWPAIYQELGFLHVLVVSGSHFSFLGWLSQRLLEMPGRLVYALRPATFPLWLGWTTACRLLLTALITVFALVVGFNPPCQRSWLSLLLTIWLPLLGAPLPAAQLDRVVVSLQAFCFPGSFLSLSNALSWSAYTLVRSLPPWPKLWQRRLLPAVEGPLIALNLAYFGTFSPGGIVLNTLLQPVWHLVLGSGLLYMIWPQPWIGQGLRFVLQHLHEAVLWVRATQQASGALCWPIPGLLRTLCWLAASWSFFGLWRRGEDRIGPCPEGGGYT